MVNFGYTLMTEQTGPRELGGHAAAAERAGFDFEVCSDHYFPWLDAMGHAPYAWSVLGAVTQVTDRVELMADSTSGSTPQRSGTCQNTVFRLPSPSPVSSRSRPSRRGPM